MLDEMEVTAWRRLARLQSFARNHPRRLRAAAAGLLSGFAVAVFGIAPMAPDVVDIPRRLVTEEVIPNDLAQQLDSLALHTLELSRAGLTRASDTADSLLRRLGVDDANAATFIRTDPEAQRLVAGRSGKMVQVRTTARGELIDLVARFPVDTPSQQLTHFTRLTIAREKGSFSSRIEIAPLVAKARLGSGTIRTSLFAAIDDARLPDVIASQLIEMFSTKVDFHRQLRKGDKFSVVFEALTADEQPIAWNEGTGRVLAGEFISNGHSVRLMWIRDGDNGGGAYFDFDGQSARRAFLASPLQFSRMTSGFAGRMHPIMNKWHEHKGIDYGAPTGTEVRSVGDGSVEFAGWQNGYGNVVQIKHSNQRSTLYAHLSRIDVKKGQHIDQGGRIGAVGATGWATGPHLHFEFRVSGIPENPMRIVSSPEAAAIAPLATEQLALLSNSMKAQIEIARTLPRASGLHE